MTAAEATGAKARSLDEWLRLLDERSTRGPADVLAVAAEAAAAYPDLAHLHSIMGRQLFHLGRFAEAEAALQTALRLDPKDRNMLQLARVYVAQGRQEEASRLVDQALADTAGRTRALGRASELRTMMCDDLDAVHLLAEAIALAPERRSIEAFEQALTNLADDAEAGVSPRDKPSYRRALEHLGHGEAEAAETLFAELARTRPSYAPAWIGLRGALEAQGRAQDALAVGQAWSAAFPAVTRSMVELGMGRTLGGRGLVFDPRDRFPVRLSHQALTAVASPEALDGADDALFVIDPGGADVQRDPVISLDGRGEDKVEVRYRTGPKFVAALNNAMVVGDSVVITRRGEIIDDLNGTKPSKYGGRRDGDDILFDPHRYGDGVRAVKCFDTPAFLMAGTTDASFGDWIVNFAPRLALGEAVGLDCPIVIRRNPPAQILDLLAALGVGRDRILFHDPDTISLFPRLYAPSWPSRDKSQPMAGVFDIYRRAALTTGQARRPMLYLSRRGVGARAMVNEPEVCDLFSRRGFQIIDPGSLRFEEVRGLFADAACVAGGFGSAFHNLCFCARKPINLVLLPAHTEFHLTEVALWHGEHGVRFGYVWGESLPDERLNQDPRHAPWRAPLDRVDRALDQILELVALENE